MYEPNCGLDNLMMSWGHDEYLYRMLKFNNAKLPDEALYMIRLFKLVAAKDEDGARITFTLKIGAKEM